MTNTERYSYFVLALLLASLPAILACTPSTDSLGGCQINVIDGSSQKQVEAAMFYKNINYYDDHPLVLSDLQEITPLDAEMSSLKVPVGYEVVLFNGENLTAPFIVLTGEIPNLFKYLFNDRARSLIYRKKTGESQTLPRIFNNPNFIGQEIFLPYGLSEPTGTDSLFGGGSIKVPSGLQVTVVTKKKARLPHSVEDVYTSDQSTLPNLGDPIVTILVELELKRK
jgi:hypothetical protein